MKYFKEKIHFLLQIHTQFKFVLYPKPLSSNNHPHLLNGCSSSLQNHSTYMASQIHLRKSDLGGLWALFLFSEDRYKKTFFVNTEGASK